MKVNVFSSSQMINEGSVMKALNSLTYLASKRTDSDLYGLILIDKFLKSIKWKTNTRSRRYGLEHVLIQSISRRFIYVATLLGLEVDREENYEQAIQSIAVYGKTNNPELIGWAWLYYRFVRLELCISAPVFSAACRITDRTLRRYQTHAVSRLTVLLIERESQARLMMGM